MSIAQLYLVTPVIQDAPAFAPFLDAALSAGGIAAVLLRLPAGADERTMVNTVKALAPAVQEAGAALLIGASPDLAALVAARGGADGAHVASGGEEALRDALDRLRPDRIVGAGGIATRHDAMQAGELGVDYVMFGEAIEEGETPAPELVAEFAAWWAEIFEVPCVALARTEAEVAMLAATGAEFVALGEWVFAEAGRVAERVASAKRVVAEASPPEAWPRSVDGLTPGAPGPHA